MPADHVSEEVNFLYGLPFPESFHVAPKVEKGRGKGSDLEPPGATCTAVERSFLNGSWFYPIMALRLEIKHDALLSSLVSVYVFFPPRRWKPFFPFWGKHSFC